MIFCQVGFVSVLQAILGHWICGPSAFSAVAASQVICLANTQKSKQFCNSKFLKWFGFLYLCKKYPKAMFMNHFGAISFNLQHSHEELQHLFVKYILERATFILSEFKIAQQAAHYSGLDFQINILTISYYITQPLDFRLIQIPNLHRTYFWSQSSIRLLLIEDWIWCGSAQIA